MAIQILSTGDKIMNLLNEGKMVDVSKLKMDGTGARSFSDIAPANIIRASDDEDEFAYKAYIKDNYTFKL
jgi:hypothetical protein